MNTNERLQPRALVALASEGDLSRDCPKCGLLRCLGWESMPGGFDRNALLRLGTLRAPDVDDPTLKEHHPDGTHGWSPDAPIATAFFPYNRCDVWQCSACRRAYLRYTEYGGYYEDERVRQELPERVLVD